MEIKETFENSVRENAGWLVGFARRRLGTDEGAEDVAQEVWIRAFRAYDRYTDCGMARAWLASIAKNHIASRLKSQVEMLSLDDKLGEIIVSDDMRTDTFTQSREAPNLWYGKKQNFFGCQVKSASVTNIRIKRGNGVLDCGEYRFAYADRYVAEDENIVLEYSFNCDGFPPIPGEN